MTDTEYDLENAPWMTYGLRRIMSSFWREAAVRIRLPGMDQTDKQLDYESSYPLTEPVTQILTENSNVSKIEILSFPGKDGQEHVLVPEIGSDPPTARDEPIDSPMEGFSLSDKQSRVNPAAEQLGDRLVESLPTEIGVELCALDLNPIGITPLPTHRMVLEENREVVSPRNITWNPVVETVKKLVRHDKPHIIQTIICPKNNKYLVSVRVLVVDPKHGIDGDSDFHKHLTEGKQYTLDDIWGNVGLKSNFDFPIDEFYRYSQFSESFRPSAAKYRRETDSFDAREIYEGNAEFDELKQGRMGYNPLYKEILGYPKMSATEEKLRNFAVVVPLYYEHKDLWEEIKWRNPPQFDTLNTLRGAAGTEQSLGSKSVPIHRDSDVVTAGGDGHVNLLSFIEQVYGEQGKEIEKLEQDSSSMPDAILHEDQQQIHIEAEVGNKSKPANILTNAARARHEGRPVVFITGQMMNNNTAQAYAERIVKMLEEPFREQTDDGVVLYNWTDALSTADGTVLLPEGETEARWELTADGMLRLRGNGRQIAEGPANEPIQSFGFESPRYRHEDGVYQIYNRDNEEMEKYRRKQNMLDDWTVARIPHVPIGLHYLEGSTIRYKNGNTIESFSDEPAWSRTAEGKLDRYEGAVSTFLRTYTMAKEGGEIRYETYRQQFKDWYNKQTDAKTPEKAMIGRAEPDHLETKRREEGGEYHKFIQDRAWIYPPDLLSPTLPFVDADGQDGD